MNESKAQKPLMVFLIVLMWTLPVLPAVSLVGTSFERSEQVRAQGFSEQEVWMLESADLDPEEQLRIQRALSPEEQLWIIVRNTFGFIYACVALLNVLLFHPWLSSFASREAWHGRTLARSAGHGPTSTNEFWERLPSAPVPFVAIVLQSLAFTAVLSAAYGGMYVMTLEASFVVPLGTTSTWLVVCVVSVVVLEVAARRSDSVGRSARKRKRLLGRKLPRLEWSEAKYRMAGASMLCVGQIALMLGALLLQSASDVLVAVIGKDLWCSVVGNLAVTCVQVALIALMIVGHRYVVHGETVTAREQVVALLRVADIVAGSTFTKERT